VSFFLRLTGITNAAVWFGAAIFLALGVWPAFGSPEMLRILPRSHSGAAAQVLLERYFILQYWCGGIALGHLFLEYLYAGKALQRWILYWLIGILMLGCVNGLISQPKLKALHLEIYGVRSTPQQREQAARSFRLWQGVVQTSNIVVILGLWVYLWETSAVNTGARFVGAGKFRS
jgi:hypothetical protein